MMIKKSSFQSCSTFEAECVKDLVAFFNYCEKKNSNGKQLILMGDEQCSSAGRRNVLDHQIDRGDAMIIQNGQPQNYIEFKCEKKTTGNLFIETYSNLAFPMNPGWLFKLNVDKIWYYFADERRLMIIDFISLKNWLETVISKKSGGGNTVRLMSFTETMQEKNSQKNRTVGRLIPVKLLEAENIIIWNKKLPSRQELGLGD